MTKPIDPREDAVYAALDRAVDPAWSYQTIRELLAAADAVDPVRARLAAVARIADEVHGHGADTLLDENDRLRMIISRISAGVDDEETNHA